MREEKENSPVKDKADELAKQIIGLVGELSALASGTANKLKKSSKSSALGFTQSTKGATGSLRMLIAEGFFDQPRQLSETIAQLKKEGRHYSKPAVSMGLLALVRPPERLLTRIQEPGSKNWKYVIRR